MIVAHSNINYWKNDAIIMLKMFFSVAVVTFSDNQLSHLLAAQSDYCDKRHPDDITRFPITKSLFIF